MGRPKKVKVEDVKVLPIPQLGKELDRFEGETFYIALHENGALYHVYNSMDLIIRPNMVSGYETLADLVKNKDVYNQLTGQEKDDFELNLSAISYILSLPCFAFASAQLTFDIATLVIEYLRKSYEEAISMPLQEETPQENLEFENATRGLEEIKNALKEENKGKLA